MLGGVAREWPFDSGRSDEHGIAPGGALDVVGDPCCVPGRHIAGTPDRSRGNTKGNVVNTRQINC